MSKISIETVKCRNCDKELKVNVYNSINVSMDHELKDRLMSGELTQVICERGQVHQLRYPILYHKMGLSNSVMIQYPQLDAEEAKEFLNSTFSKGCSQSPLLAINETFEVYNDWEAFIERIKEIG